MAITIRSATHEDVEAILTVEQQAATAGHWTLEQYQQCIAQGFLSIAEAEGRLSGFLCAREAAREWEIENVVVAESMQRRGIADRLLQEFLQHVSSQRAAAIWLEVRESNQPARRLYEKHGFGESGRRRAYYRNPEEDAVLYSLRLSHDGE